MSVQTNAFQRDAFQITGVAVEAKSAYQIGAFQSGAFQIIASVSPAVVNDWGSDKARRAKIKRNQTPKVFEEFDLTDDDLFAIGAALIAGGVLCH